MSSMFEVMIVNGRCNGDYEDMIAWAGNNYLDGVYQDLPQEDLEAGIHYDNIRADVCSDKEIFDAVHTAWKAA